MERNLVCLARGLETPVRSSRGIRGGSGDIRPDHDIDSSDEETPAAPKPGNQAPSIDSTPLPAPPAHVPSLSPLLRVLLGFQPPSEAGQALVEPALPFFNASLNGPQKEALSRAMSAKDVHLIHGPPGTGKTTVLVELVLQLVLGKGERVLVAGSSNLAVDNLAARLLPFRKGREKDIRAIRIGRE